LTVDNTADVDAHSAAQEARLDESLDYEEDKRTIDRARDLLDSISEPLYLLSDFEREFLAVLVDSPLDAALCAALEAGQRGGVRALQGDGFCRTGGDQRALAYHERRTAGVVAAARSAPGLAIPYLLFVAV
jgi:hypothetical protein